MKSFWTVGRVFMVYGVMALMVFGYSWTHMNRCSVTRNGFENQIEYRNAGEISVLALLSAVAWPFYVSIEVFSRVYPEKPLECALPPYANR